MLVKWTWNCWDKGKVIKMSNRYCGTIMKRRPDGWTDEDEKALQDEFTVHGHCGCDGAMDFGCPWCTPKKFDEWWLKRILGRAIEVSRRMAERCAGCDCKLSGFVTGKNPIPKGTVCDDCYYGEMGEELDAHPIGRIK
jgi:hypothetical protein